MSLTKAPEIISVFRKIYSKKKARRYLNCVGYKCRGVKSRFSFSNFYNGIKVQTLGLKSDSEKEKKTIGG